MHSFWENRQWFSDIDFTIVGSGIVGIQCALHLKKKHPKSKIIILERGYLPAGASSKNAGFACFGSPSEILSDLKQSSADQVAALVEMRVLGLETLKTTCGTSAIDFESLGSHEVFTPLENNLYQECADRLPELNQLLHSIFGENIFVPSDDAISQFGFQQVSHLIKNIREGQIDTGKMIRKLLNLAKVNDIEILNGAEVTSLNETSNHVDVHLQSNFSFASKKVFVANNGFASTLLKDLDVKPARAQVLVTTEIPNLPFQGTFHMMEGYYYFRNIGKRVLFGGGRNLDIDGETTTELSTSGLIQKDLEKKLKEIILPDYDFEVDMRWAGIMGVGDRKLPIVKHISDRIICGVRMGGMGVAIGSLIGKNMAELNN